MDHYHHHHDDDNDAMDDSDETRQRSSRLGLMITWRSVEMSIMLISSPMDCDAEGHLDKMRGDEHGAHLLRQRQTWMR